MDQIGRHIILILAVLVMGGPLWLVLISATHSGGAFANGGGALLPGRDLFDNIARLAAMGERGPGLANMLWTSFVTGVGVAFFTVVCGFLTAFATVYFQRPGLALAFGATMLTLYYPVEARMLPTFDVANSLGLVDTRIGLILPVLPLALATFVFRQHLRQLPPEIMEAARLDGIRPLKFLKDFALPLSASPIIAVGVVAFIWGWNQYLWPLMVAINQDIFPVMRGLSLLGNGGGASMTLAALSLLPPLVLVLLFHRRIAGLATLRD